MSDFCLGHLTKVFIICYEAGFCQPTIPQRPSSHFRDCSICVKLFQIQKSESGRPGDLRAADLRHRHREHQVGRRRRAEHDHKSHPRKCWP